MSIVKRNNKKAKSGQQRSRQPVLFEQRIFGTTFLAVGDIVMVYTLVSGVVSFFFIKC